MIGTTVSHYKIIEKLGEGGMGVIYKAEDLRLKRLVAIKFLPRELSIHGEERERFTLEAQAASSLNHPYICTIHEIDEANEETFIVMEYIEGVTLREWIADKARQSEGYRKLGMKEAVDLALQIAEGLEKAHEKGIIHRDVKSENIMVTADGRAKIMDFGLAKLRGVSKLTKAGSTVGTIAYMSPEQVEGTETDHRTDIFSFGVVLYELLAGQLPFRAEHETAMMYEIINVTPKPLTDIRQSADAELNRVVMKCLEKDRDVRYQSMRDVAVDLKRYRRDSSGTHVDRSSVVRETAPKERSVRKPSSNWLKVAAGGTIAVLLAVGAWYLYSSRSTTIDSLAVLPFENTGDDQDLEYLSDGVTESIINNLTKIQRLRVVPRSSAFRFKGKDIDLQEVGSKLNVRTILTGRIVRRASVLDVQVDLIDVENESQLWGNRYQVDLDGALSLQEKITKEVSSILDVGLSSETTETLTKSYTENAQAYQLYIQGRYFWNKRNAMALERAVSYFQESIALDSTFALAYSGLADCYIVQPQYAGVPTRIAIPLAQINARRALELDNDLAEAHSTVAFCYFGQFNYEEAEREFTLALALNPRYPTTLHWYGIMLGRTGHPERYLSLIQQAQEIDPYSPIITMNVGVAHMISGHHDEAMHYFRKSIELDPSFASGYGFMGLLNGKMKKYSEAIPQLEKAVELSGSSSEQLGNLGYVYAKAGQKTQALKLLREIEKRYRAGTGAAYNVARIYAGLDEKEKVLQWLGLDYGDRSTWISWLLNDFVWDDVRSDPRFIELTKKVGLVK